MNVDEASNAVQPLDRWRTGLTGSEEPLHYICIQFPRARRHQNRRGHLPMTARITWLQASRLRRYVLSLATAMPSRIWIPLIVLEPRGLPTPNTPPSFPQRNVVFEANPRRYISGTNLMLKDVSFSPYHSGVVCHPPICDILSMCKCCRPQRMRYKAAARATERDTEHNECYGSFYTAYLIRTMFGGVWPGVRGPQLATLLPKFWSVAASVDFTHVPNSFRSGA